MNNESEDNLQRLFLQLSKIIEEYPETEDMKMNIFRILHKEHDERRLHSRFISYLLSPNNSHNNKQFLELFFKNFHIDMSPDFVEVYPTESEKSEYRNIDILIIDKVNNKAVIIENKIYASDSNKNDATGDEPKGQIARYYKRIENEGINDIVVLYLKPFKASPSKGSYFDKEGTIIEKVKKKTKLIDYVEDITKWLRQCVDVCSDTILERYIKQYLEIITKMTGDIKERIRIKNLIGASDENIKATKLLISNWNHVKWHTVHEFWTKLQKELKEKYINVQLYPDEYINEDGTEFNKTIKNITYYNKDINHGILFEIKKNTIGYISGKGELSWGIENSQKKWTNFSDKKLKNICFSKFSNDNTFSLINSDNIEGAVKSIIDEIEDAKKDGFKDLNTVD
ncbi:PD-(D/E)XK nuclease family protein [Odoribacter sp. OttesenSCG-928-L07]|nr:PD-(D/E)XK nuclease family protein [Odoribacter sp. OttesenSCG-928-L07]MDL2238765.1 PD-(D/E)XK nuclease family protein [Bacteroidales bacterium OttesenSCG-928-L14]MDL2241252.1 PD-(D/E)XK nuclease family protein [Bacteroidales bacterium OttesenSCG-928-K22]